jgi:hypothetical protein
MKRMTLIAVCIAAAGAIAVGMLTGCITGGSEPPFETKSGAERMEEAQEGFGWYTYQPKGTEKVRVHRVVFPGQWDRGFDELPVDIYYPPRFSYQAAEPAVIVIAGSTEWSANISLAAMLAAEGIPTVVIHSQAAGEKVPEAVARLRSQAEELFIDPGRLALWSEGHAVPTVLETLLDRSIGFHEHLCCGVFFSPKMFIGNGQPFKYPEEAMSADVPLFIAKAENDDFYEINASVEKFMEAAERYGLEVEYEESPVGGHNWMLEEDDKEAIAVVRSGVRFLKEHLQS